MAIAILILLFILIIFAGIIFINSLNNNNKLNKIMQTLDQVLQAVTDESTLDDSIITLLNGISQQLKDALSGEKLSPAAQAKVDSIFAAVEANKAKVSEAITVNTPVEETPTEEPTDDNA